jgi:predicted regulator of Ras-like GTPase activity (Roadblock/LC7/MglB family)
VSAPHETGPRVETGFSTILERLVEETPGAIGAAFADDEGEAVDSFGEGDRYEVLLAAAHMGVLLRRFEASRKVSECGTIREIWITAENGQIVCRPLGHGYQVTVVLQRCATIPKLEKALDRALVHLRLEAGGIID